MARVKCPKCEWVNTDGAQSCARCKTPLPRVKIEPVARTPEIPPRPRSADAFTFRPGQVIASRYSVLSMIGRGGMGCIYRVRDNVLKEDVALKTLLPQFVRDKMVVERFFNEARIARSLSHPNIVRVHDIGMTGNVIYISMELVSGKSLRAVLDEIPAGTRLPVKTALHIIDELCAALEYAHRHTVHRDIKPENVMICGDGSVKLMDFGISKLMDTTRLTGTDIVMGTPFYMSPEQLRNSAGVDARADIYSVGVMLYEILTGNMPTGVPKPASQLTSEVPPELDPIVAKCVDPDPDRRYQSASELRATLRPVIQQVDSGTGVGPTPEEASAVRRRQLPMRHAIGVALLVVIVALTGAGLYRLEAVRRAQPPKPPQAKTAAPADTPAARFDDTFRQIGDVIAKVKARVPADAETNREMRKVLNDAKARWELATRESARQDPKTLVLARQALQCYIALALWKPDMAFVPPGTVTLRDGSVSNAVSLDGFFIDTTEVTNGQYLAFCTATGWRSPPYDLQNAPSDRPVIQVTFYDAQAYAAWAGKRLPTEAQWARAAYGDRMASEQFPWGDDWRPGFCNSGGADDVAEFAAQVGSFPEDRAWSGGYDMTGNVSEWTRSAFRELPYDPADGREDPAALYFGTLISVRGGNYKDTARTPLNARFAWPFETSADTIGFRCVFELPESL